MRVRSLRNASFLLLTAPLLLAACASTSQVESAQNTANEAKAEADRAKQTAQQALTAAQQAQQTAQAADQRASTMYNRSLKK